MEERLTKLILGAMSGTQPNPESTQPGNAVGNAESVGSESVDSAEIKWETDLNLNYATPKIFEIEKPPKILEIEKPLKFENMIMASPVVKFFSKDQERTDVLPAILYAIGTPEFQVFANAIHGEDQKMSFVDIVQVYILVTGPTSGNKQICTSHEQLQIFVDDPSAGNKSLYKDVKLQSKLTSVACAEAAAMFMELHEFFKSSKVKGHDGIANPNEL